jgi:DNA replication and repair protein RecF
MVVLAPEHAKILTGGGEERRTYIDQFIFSITPEYLTIAQKYKRALRQKQALLRQSLPQGVFLDHVAPWNQELVLYGELMRMERRKLVGKIFPIVTEHYQKLSGSSSDVRMSYYESQKPLSEELTAMAIAEHRAARALCGPHRDDLKVELHAHTMSAASQGERGSMLLALKLAEIQTLHSHHKKDPILLLDDVGATLDGERRSRLFSFIQETQGQTLISSAEKEVIEMVRASGGRILRRVDENSLLGFSIARWVPA